METTAIGNRLDLNDLIAKLNSFLDELRIVHGFSVSLNSYVEVEKLILYLIELGQLPQNEKDLADILAPIICKSSIEQLHFRQIFEEWLARNGVQFLPEKTKEIEPGVMQTEAHLKQFKLLYIYGALAIILLGVIFLLAVGRRNVGYNSSESESIAKPQPTTESADPGSTGGAPINIDEFIGNHLAFVIAVFTILMGVFFSILFYYIVSNLLKRRYPLEKESFKIQSAFLPSIEKEWDEPQNIARIAPKLNRTILTNRQEVNINATVEATVKQAGLYSPVLEREAGIPQYLFLIDKITDKDHQSLYLDTLIDVLDEHHVRFKKFYFDFDIRSCYDPLNGNPLFLSMLSHQYPDHVLVVCSNGDSMLDTYYQRIGHWVGEELNNWEHKILLTPEHLSSHHNKYKEFQSLDFAIFPLSAKGIIALIQSDFVFTGNIGDSEISHFLPPALAHLPIRWIDHHPPEEDNIADLVQEIRSYLGERGFLWFSACAIYPEVHWELTLYYGFNLSYKEQSALYHPQLLFRMISLPWLRHGYIPDWLRSELIKQMPKDFQKQARQKTYLLFFESFHDKIDKFKLNFVASIETIKVNLGKYLFKSFQKNQGRFSPLKEQLFNSFLNNDLSVRIPRLYKRVFSENHQATLYIIGVHFLVSIYDIFISVFPNLGMDKLNNIIIPMAFFSFSSNYFKPYQLLSYSFVNGSLMSTNLSCIVIYSFGVILEEIWGTRRFVLFYFSVGVLSIVFYSLLLTIISNDNTYPPTTGSGAIEFALFMAYAIIYPNKRINWLFFFRSKSSWFSIKAKYFIPIILLLDLIGSINHTPGYAPFICTIGGTIGFLFVLYWRMLGFEK